MNIRRLQIFESVARLGGFSRAAQELHMAQPAVSIAVKKLEEELGVALLDRAGRQLRLTAEGAEALAGGRQILFQADSLKQRVAEMAGLAKGELSLACPSMLATYFLPGLLSPFLKAHGGIQASVHQAGTQAIEAMLLAGEVELGVVIVDQVSPQLEVTPLIQEEMVVCLHQDHPFAARAALSVEEAASLDLIMYEQEYFLRVTLDKLFAEAGIQPAYRMQTNFLPLIAGMVKQQLGATVALRMMAANEPELQAVSLQPGVSFQLGLARLKTRRLSSANSALVEWLESGRAVSPQVGAVRYRLKSKED